MNNNSIFHYTDELKNICLIIENGFIPSFCRESLCSGENCIDFAIPLVSFCDIALTKSGEHKSKYGKFAIGVKKSWALKNDINPISYINNIGNISKSVIGVLSQHKNALLEFSDDEKKLAAFHHINTISHFKSYNGKVVLKKNNTMIDVKFYDEKEWRHVMYIVDKNDDFQIPFYNSTQFGEMAIKYPSSSKPHFPNNALKLKPHDITHLIVPTKKDKNELIQCLKKLFSRTTDGDKTFYELLTKVLTYDDIKYDL